MIDAYLYDGLRSPIGRHGGGLASIRPDDMAATLIRAVLDRSPFTADQVEDVVLGNTTQSGEDSRNVARHAALLAGLPVDVAGQTVNRLCGSGLAAAIDAARAIRCGDGSVYIAGGVESMTRAPFILGKSEQAWGRDGRIFDSTIGVRFPNSRLVAEFGNHSMPETADNVAADLGLRREDCDLFAAASQRKYAAAKQAGFFDGEIHPLTIPGRKGDTTVSADEHPRAETNVESLAKLKPLFAGGVVTAGNASGINDGACALVMGNLQVGQAAGAKPMARILSVAVAGIAPRVMGLGPVPACRKALNRAGLSLADMDLIEINEAFAAQVLGCLKLLNLSADDSRLNPNGGAIAIGHPLGCSGARLLLTAARHLRNTNGRYALVSLCIGVGHGIAMVIENVKE